MKHKLWLMTLLLSGALMQAGAVIEEKQLKADLIGQCMGGREKCWTFQSPDQIKELLIKSRNETAEGLVFTIGLQLQATDTAPPYAAEARVEYARDGTGWKFKYVGLLSLAKK